MLQSSPGRHLLASPTFGSFAAYPTPKTINALIISYHHLDDIGVITLIRIHVFIIIVHVTSLIMKVAVVLEGRGVGHFTEIRDVLNVDNWPGEDIVSRLHLLVCLAFGGSVHAQG